MRTVKASKDSFHRLFGGQKIPGQIRKGANKYKCLSLTVSANFGTLHIDEETPKGMCPQFSDGARSGPAFQAAAPRPEFRGKPVRLVCPFCKRRVTGRIGFCHDGDCMFHMLPLHKPKKWWKKGKPRKIRN